MTARILDGKMVAEKVLASIKKEVTKLSRPPCVTFVRVGEHAPSITYVKTKQAMAERVGIESRLVELPEKVTQAQLVSVVHTLGADRNVDGILVQSPLPKQINPQEIFNAILPAKDVDGFSAFNMGRLVQGDPNAFIACTPLGIEALLSYYKIPVEGAHVVVVGRSLIVGRPLSILLSTRSRLNATVSSCNRQTKNLRELCRSADILVVAAGAPGLVKGDWVREGAVVVDVGITRVKDNSNPKGYRLSGDVLFDEVKEVAGWLSPVPGGVGPMTVAMLMQNTLKAAKGK